MSAEPYLPKRKTLTSLARAVDFCKGCDLYKKATQGVMGEGSRSAKIMFVGEQPGDAEDKAGKPFVGPAGRVFDEALEEAGIDRRSVFVTNAVKHFKWEPRGKRRLHKKPSARELQACRPWLDAELKLIEPAGIVCLGATAAQALLGREFRITRQRGERLAFEDTKWIMATWHPSAVLRAPDTDSRRQMQDELVADLKLAASLLRSSSSGLA
jgi:DNA polymerase